MSWFKRGFVCSVYGLLYLPILVLVVYSFNSAASGFQWEGFGFTGYKELWANQDLIDAAWRSVWLGVVAASLSTLLGTLIAFVLHRFPVRGKRALTAMLFVVLMSPDIVVAICLLILFIFLGIELGFVSLLLAHITFCLPFVVITVHARLQGFNNQIIDAARDLGASEWYLLLKVILPLLFPAIAASWLLAFTLSLDDVVISTFVSGPTYEILPLHIYSMVRLGLRPEVNALATLLLMFSLLTLMGSQWLLTRRRFILDGQKI